VRWSWLLVLALCACSDVGEDAKPTPIPLAPSFKKVIVGRGRPKPPPEPQLAIGTLELAAASYRAELPIVLETARALTVDLDWDIPADAGGLSAGVVLTSRPWSGDPREASEWLSVKWIGIPRGQKVRLAVESRVAGRYRALDLFGWPDDQAGRAPARRMRLELTRAGLGVLLDGKEVFRVADTGLPLDRAWVHLGAWSHTGAPPMASFTRLALE